MIRLRAMNSLADAANEAVPMTTATAPAAIGLQLLVDSVDDIAALPDLTAKIIKTADDPNGNAFQLLKIVSHDPALVAKILKLVNSSFYALPNKVASLEKAIPMLGMGGIRNLAISSSVAGMFRGGELCDGYGTRDLWTHSIAVAVVARELARKAKLGIADEAFLVGMLHDLGLLVIHQKLPQQLRSVCEMTLSQERSFYEVEREMLGFDHSQVGAALAARWKFPASVKNAIEFHHHPADAPPEHRRLATLAYVSDTLCGHTDEGFNLTACFQQLDEELLAMVPLTSAMVEETLGKLKELVAAASPFAA
jgi:putative nucleotidyltransferase with HDIG domain